MSDEKPAVDLEAKVAGWHEDRLCKQALEINRLRYALRTRPEYDFRCDCCGAPHNLDTSIPSEQWNAIAGDKYGALCTLCIDDLLTEKGLTCEAEFYFVGKALVSRLYGQSIGDLEEAEREIGSLKAQLAEALRERDLAVQQRRTAEREQTNAYRCWDEQRVRADSAFERLEKAEAQLAALREALEKPIDGPVDWSKEGQCWINPPRKVVIAWRNGVEALRCRLRVALSAPAQVAHAFSATEAPHSFEPCLHDGEPGHNFTCALLCIHCGLPEEKHPRVVLDEGADVTQEQ